MGTGDRPDRRAAIGIGIVGSLIAVVLTGLVTGVAQQVGSQLYNSGCWITAGDIRLGRCTGAELPDPVSSPEARHRDATAAPALSPTPPPEPTDVPFLAHVPAAIRSTCTATTLAGASTAIACRPGSVVDEVVYRRYETRQDLADAYAALLPPGLVSVDDCSVGASDVQTAIGRLGCYDSPVLKRLIFWTDDELGILTVARSRDASYRDLAAWTSTAGPVP